MEGESAPSVTVEPLNPVHVDVYVEPKLASCVVTNGTGYGATCLNFYADGQARVNSNYATINKSKSKTVHLPYANSGVVVINTSQSATITGENVEIKSIENLNPSSGYSYLVRYAISTDSDDSLTRYIRINA